MILDTLVISCLSFSLIICFSHRESIMSTSLSVGIFVYMFVISNDTKWRFESKRISRRSFIRWVEFFTLNMFGSGMYCWRFFDSNLAIEPLEVRPPDNNPELNRYVNT